MKIDVVNTQGDKVSTAELPESIFAAPIRRDLMHQALVRQLANARRGTHKTKQRNEVSGGGRKPWRQKGTGRARHGSNRSPLWVGGGKVHTPQPRDYGLRMPRKMRRAALRSALSVVAGGDNMVVVDELTLGEPRTREMAAILENLGGSDGALIVLGAPNENVEMSIRNLPTAKALRANYVNVRDLLGSKRVILSLDAIGALQSFLGPEKGESGSPVTSTRSSGKSRTGAEAKTARQKGGGAKETS